MLRAPPGRHNLQALSLNNNRLGDDGVIDLARYLSKTLAPKLRVLTLRDNCVGTAGITALTGSDFLEHLTILDLAGNRLSSSSVVALVQRFGHGAPALEELHLSGSEISGDDAAAIGNALWRHVDGARRLRP